LKIRTLQTVDIQNTKKSYIEGSFSNGNFRKDNLKIRTSQTADIQNTKKSYIEAFFQ